MLRSLRSLLLVFAALSLVITATTQPELYAQGDDRETIGQRLADNLGGVVTFDTYRDETTSISNVTVEISSPAGLLFSTEQLQTVLSNGTFINDAESLNADITVDVLRTEIETSNGATTQQDAIISTRVQLVDGVTYYLVESYDVVQEPDTDEQPSPSEGWIVVGSSADVDFFGRGALLLDDIATFETDRPAIDGFSPTTVLDVFEVADEVSAETVELNDGSSAERFTIELYDETFIDNIDLLAFTFPFGSNETARQYSTGITYVVSLTFDDDRQLIASQLTIAYELVDVPGQDINPNLPADSTVDITTFIASETFITDINSDVLPIQAPIIVD